jgi:DsbE subfamily thiol:disulfide oxidoreductase
MSDASDLTGPSTPETRERLDRLWTAFGVLRLGLIAAAALLVAAVMWHSATSRAASDAEFALDAPQGMTAGNGFPLPGVSAADLKGRVTVLNIWASWCPECRAEHETLLNLTGQGDFRLVGIAMNDKEAETLAYLRKNGNPYAALGMDPRGAVGRGVYGARGVPTTLVLDRNGDVVTRLEGSLDKHRIRSELVPAVRKAAAAN